MKRWSVFVFIFFTMMLCSCGNTSNKIEPIKSEIVDFDRNAAMQMIKKVEKAITEISIKDTITREECIQFLTDIDDIYDGYEEVQWEYIFFYNEEFDDESIKTLHLKKDMFYPTIYHKDVEIVSAQIENEYYQEKFFNNSLLTIREEYLGEDSNLKGWYREYLYKKDHENQWVFYAFGGYINSVGEGFTSDYLELKY